MEDQKKFFVLKVPKDFYLELLKKDYNSHNCGSVSLSANRPSEPVKQLELEVQLENKNFHLKGNIRNEPRNNQLLVKFNKSSNQCKVITSFNQVGKLDNINQYTAIHGNEQASQSAFNVYQKYKQEEEDQQLRKIKVMSSDEPRFGNEYRNLDFIIHKEHNMIYNNNNPKNSLKNRRVRMDEADLKNIIFDLFSEHDELSFNQLSQSTNQPQEYLKEILQGICEAKKNQQGQGVRQKIYKLRQEFRQLDLDDQKKKKPKI